MQLEHTKNMNHFMDFLMSNPDRYTPLIDFLDQICLNASELTWKDCELIAQHISEENESPFCTGLHQGIAAEISELSTHEQKMPVILSFASKVNISAKSISNVDIQAVIDAGWNQRTIEDVIALVASIRVFNTLANSLGFGVIPERAFTQMGQATVQFGSNLKTFNMFLSMVGS